MTYQFHQVHIDNGQLVISKDDIIPKTLGEGEEKIKHSAYIYGPLQVGEVTDFDINSTLHFAPKLLLATRIGP